MRDAIQACSDAGIALTAIKTQALLTNPEAQIGAETPSARAAIERLTERGSGGGPGEAPSRLVRRPRRQRALADDGRLDAGDELRGGPGARAARSRASARSCASTPARRRRSTARAARRYASRASRVTIPISRVLRYAMYADGYRDLDRARAAFAALPAATRRAIASADYGPAERACPRGIEIGKAMRRTAALLS